MARPKSQKLVTAYCEGQTLGTRTLPEWCSSLGIIYGNAWAAWKNGRKTLGLDGKWYTFQDAGEPPRPNITIKDMDTICKAEGKHYGALQTELLNGRVITPDDAEEAKRKITPPETVEAPESEERTEDMEVITAELRTPENVREVVTVERQGMKLSDFAKMADETTIVVQDEESWLLTAPSESPVFDRLGDWMVDSFRADTVDGAVCLKVWVRI